MKKENKTKPKAKFKHLCFPGLETNTIIHKVFLAGTFKSESSRMRRMSVVKTTRQIFKDVKGSVCLSFHLQTQRLPSKEIETFFYSGLL